MVNDSLVLLSVVGTFISMAPSPRVGMLLRSCHSLAMVSLVRVQVELLCSLVNLIVVLDELADNLPHIGFIGESL